VNKPDLVPILQREGVELMRKGRALWARCPLHQDKTPSFKVAPHLQTWRCFGCGAGGDVISFIQAKRKISFSEALAVLGIKANKQYKPDPTEFRKRELVKVFRLWCRNHAIALAMDLRTLRGIVAGIRTPEDLERRAWAYHEIPTIEYRLDLLQYGSDEAKYRLQKEASNESTF